MRRAIRALLREPLVLFLVAGAGVFLLWSARNGPSSPTSHRIVVTLETVQNLAENWTRTRLRPPTSEELHGLVEDHIREEVFYREALSLGLDRDDTVIRRRLRQKLEFVSDDLGAYVQPADEQLQDYLDKNSEQFRRDPRFTWSHVFLSGKRHSTARADTAQRLLAALNGPAGDDNARRQGDPFVLALDFETSTSAEVTALFGDAFATTLARLEPGRWYGPIPSAYGDHLVLVRQRVPGRIPELREIREAVQREWQTTARREANETFYQKLRSRYRIVIETPSGVAERTAEATGG
jgi:hypothetical protein